MTILPAEPKQYIHPLISAFNKIFDPASKQINLSDQGTVNEISRITGRPPRDVKNVLGGLKVDFGNEIIKLKKMVEWEKQRFRLLVMGKKSLKPKETEKLKQHADKIDELEIGLNKIYAEAFRRFGLQLPEQQKLAGFENLVRKRRQKLETILVEVTHAPQKKSLFGRVGLIIKRGKKPSGRKK